MKTIDQMVQKQYGNRTERIVQFGEGNFLRAFADWMIDRSNEQGGYNGSIVVCQPIAHGMTEQLASQNNIYTVIVRGREHGEPKVETRVVTSISRCINPYRDYQALLELAANPEIQVVISNTTEAGIAYNAGDKLSDAPPVSYPAKLTAFLYHRYKALGPNGGELLIIPCELIDNNGKNLHRIVLQYAQEWELERGFFDWIERMAHFTSTLVDRIVTGYPKTEAEQLQQELGYQDNMMVVCEPYNLFAIEGKQEWAESFPIHKANPGVVWTDDVAPYKLTKVRILNGSHTASALPGYLAGFDSVLEMMGNPTLRRYINDLIYKEVIPVTDVDRKELSAFAAEVEGRYDNPFLQHRLLDISLNSCAKFNARCMPTLLECIHRNGTVPPLMCFALAGLIAFYRVSKENDGYFGVRSDGTRYRVVDDLEVLAFFSFQWENCDAANVVHNVLSHKEFWSDRDLTKEPGLEGAVIVHLESILSKGVEAALVSLLG